MVADKCLYIVTHIALKISIALLLLRLLVRRWQRIAVYATLAITVVLNVIFLFIVAFQCGTKGNYLTNVLAQRCLPFGPALALVYWQGAVTTATDVAFAVLPIFMLWSLKVNTKTKIAIWLILSLGCL